MKTAEKQNALDVQVAGTHYKEMRIQPVEFIHANNIGFCEATAIKYLCRWRKKGGIEDLKKAKHFIDVLIELETRGQEPEMTMGICRTTGKPCNCPTHWVKPEVKDGPYCACGQLAEFKYDYQIFKMDSDYFCSNCRAESGIPLSQFTLMGRL